MFKSYALAFREMMLDDAGTEATEVGLVGAAVASGASDLSQNLASASGDAGNVAIDAINAAAGN
jgi:hypothetical protein